MQPDTAMRTFCVGVLAAVAAGMPGCPMMGGPSDFPPISRFDNAPYELIAEGDRPAAAGVPAKVPALAAGAKVAFYAEADGRLGALYCPNPLQIHPRVPRADRTLSLASAEGGIALAHAEGAMSTSSAAGGIVLAQAGGEMTAHTATGGLQAQTTTGQVDVAQTQTGVVTQTGGTQTTAVASTTGERTAVETHAVTPTAEALAGMQRLVDRDFFRIFTADDLLRLTRDENLLRMLADKSLLEILRDKDILTALQERGLLDPFFERLVLHAYYDKDDKPIDLAESDVPSAEERDRIRDLIEDRGDLASLVSSPDAAAVRQKLAPPAGAKAAATLDVEALPAGVYYGHKLGLLISIRNTGTAPLFDATILDGLPDRTTFFRFANDPDQARGHVPYWSRKHALLAVKLTRPLAPGETFRTLIILRADPWTIQKPPVQPAAAGK